MGSLLLDGKSTPDVMPEVDILGWLVWLFSRITI